MSKIIRNISLVLLPVIMLGLGWELGNTASRKQLQSVEKQLEFLYTGSVGSGQVIQDPEKEVDFALLYGVWRLLLRYYIQPEDLKVQPMIYGATMGLVNAIGDPYTTFMTPKQNDNFQQSMQGKLEGIGAQLTMKNGNVVVVAPLKGSPAQSAGMKSEDIIVTVDREQITEETLNQVVQRIRGEKGTKVVIGVAREGEDQIIELTITRDEIKVPSTEMEIKETDSGSIGILSINKFGEETARDTEEAIEEMLEKNVIGIILDVRFNGGGYLERAVEMTSLFIQKGKVVSVARRDTEPEHHYVNGRPMTTDIPLVILVNEGSASASEIMAGALQDHKRATIIGVTTFGKGTVQEIFELPGGSSMRITTAHWLMPNGKNLSKEGIDPDIVVERTVDQMKENIDPQLDAAIDLLQNKE